MYPFLSSSKSFGLTGVGWEGVITLRGAGIGVAVVYLVRGTRVGSNPDVGAECVCECGM